MGPLASRLTNDEGAWVAADSPAGIAANLQQLDAVDLGALAGEFR
jgi:hypothetical protein